MHEYFDEIEQLSAIHHDLEIYKGLEVDYIPDEINPLQFNDVLDYTIGSVHFVEKFSDGRGWEIDGSHQSFLEGLEKIFAGNIKAVVVRYFELTREMIKGFPPTIIGHLDKIKIQNIENKFFNENDSWYQQEVIKTIEAIEDSDCIVEVNTRGLYQKKSYTTYPSPWILQLILEKNIPITINSDAHHADDLIACFPETAKFLRQLGFQQVAALYDGQWRQHYFDEHGIT
jgi:histidinol-phosphatase (PHP family)